MQLANFVTAVGGGGRCVGVYAVCMSVISYLCSHDVVPGQSCFWCALELIGASPHLIECADRVG